MLKKDISLTIFDGEQQIQFRLFDVTEPTKRQNTFKFSVWNLSEMDLFLNAWNNSQGLWIQYKGKLQCWIVSNFQPNYSNGARISLRTAVFGPNDVGYTVPALNISIMVE